MTEVSQILRLSKVAKEFNIGLQTIVDFLSGKGHHIEANPNAKITSEMYDFLVKEFQSEKNVKEESRRLGLSFARKETITLDDSNPVVHEKEIESKELLIKDLKSVVAGKKEIFKTETKIKAPKVLGKIDTDKLPMESKTTKKKEITCLPDRQAKNKKVTEKVKSKKTKEEEKEKRPAEKEKRIEKVEEQQKETVKEKKASEKEAAYKSDTAETGAKSKIKVVGRIDLDSMNVKTKPARKTKAKKDAERKARFPKKKIITKEEDGSVVIEEKEIPQEKKELPDNFLPTEMVKLGGPTILGRMELPAMKELHKKPPTDPASENKSKKKKRKRIKKDFKINSTQEIIQDKSKVKEKKTVHKKDYFKPAVSEEEIQKQIKETLARLSGSGKSKASKYRRQKREMISQHTQQEIDRVEGEAKIIKVTEFVTANELASMMNVSVTQIISTCMSLGLFVSINQRMDAETLSIIADEFGYKVEFVSVDVQEAIKEVDDNPEDITPRHPIVTVMGHVDHGKTSLLDYIRKTNVIAGEAGGITQHIGAYEVLLENGKKITFLDTPGHEAFTAMRARGAKVTDIVIVVIAAEENVMPQTIEAINHAVAAGVPIVFAINKIDKPSANPEKIKEQLANMNYLVEDWGGKYQSQEISAKKGVNVEQLLDKVLLEAELLDLKANEEKNASGTVIESSLDKGRGYISKVLVQNGAMRIGDMVLAGCTYGRIKAMFNERNLPVKTAGPSTPVLLLGLNGAPQAGDKFNVMDDEHEVKSIATKRLQLQREQGLRTQKHITLDEIGRRIAIGDFKELNLIIKGDMDGSVEALTDALLKQSTMQVQVNVIHKSVGLITESDVLLASASNAIIIGFQVRPSMSARKLAEQEQIDIRLYSIIYNAINELKSAIEGMLAPEIEEKIICNLEIRDVFKITKVGTVAGCMVLDGKITRNTMVRLIRDGIVVYSGELGSLKRFKDDAKEVSAGYECGLNIANFNDIKAGDIIEGYETVEVKRKL
ncbi:MAG: translation initiation factor IF-2 [Bacteroidales bacterium]